MKKSALLFTVFIFGCSWFMKLDINKAKAVVVGLEQKINSGDYAGTSQYYSDEMNSSETTEQRAAKFKQLHDALGDFVSMDCIHAVDTTDYNDIHCVKLIYKIKHTTLTSIEQFVVISQGTSYRIESHIITRQ